MQNDMRDRLVNLIIEAMPYSEIERQPNKLADYLIANGVIVPPCKVGETLYLVQVDYEGNYGMTPIVVSSKITMRSILRAYEEKTIVYMSTNKDQAEQKLKELNE